MITTFALCLAVFSGPYDRVPVTRTCVTIRADKRAYAAVLAQKTLLPVEVIASPGFLQVEVTQ